MAMLSGFFEGNPEAEITEEQTGVIGQLRRAVLRLVNAKKSIEKGLKEIKEAKKEVAELFKSLPDEIKRVENQKPTEIAGRTFQRVTKTIRIDDNLVITKQRVDTTMDREKIDEVFDRHLKKSSLTVETLAEITTIRNEIRATMSPHITEVVSVEKQRRPKRS